MYIKRIMHFYFISALLSLYANAESYDTVYAETVNATMMGCEGFEELCGKCNATAVYYIQNIEDFQIDGYLESTVDMVEEILGDFAQYMPSCDWYLSISTETYCISALDIDGDPLYEGMLEDYLELAYSPSPVPQFEQQSELIQIDYLAHKGTGFGFYVSEILLQYSITSTNYFADVIELESSKKRMQLTHKQGIVKYLGLAYTHEENIYCNFSSTVEYNAVPSEVIVILHTEYKFLLGEWTSATYASAGCGEVPTPNGLNDMSNLTVGESTLVLELTGESLLMSEFNSYFIVPDFAVAPGVAVSDVGGTMSVSEAECEAVFIGVWHSIKEFHVKLMAGENEEYVLLAEISELPRSMALIQYQDMLETFYFDSIPIFPTYSEPALLVEDLQSIILHNPQIVLTFNPEAVINLHSIGEISEYNDTYIEFSTLRSDSLITTTGFLTTKAGYSLFSLSSLAAEEIYFGEAVFTISPSGILVELEIFPSCATSELCQVVESGLTSSLLSNYYFPVDFYLFQVLRPLWIDLLSFPQPLLKLYLYPCDLQVTGAYNISVSGSSSVYFDGKIVGSRETGNVIPT